MKKKLHLISLLLVSSLMLFIVSSCGIIELDEGEETTAVSMRLERDTICVMVGDTFHVDPVFSPDTVCVKDLYWTHSDTTGIVSIKDNLIIAEKEGITTVSVVSVLDRLSAECRVQVLPIWDEHMTVSKYPYDMVIYADVTFDGKPFDPETMTVAAFSSGQCRGIGEMHESHGIKYMVLRIYSSLGPNGFVDVKTRSVTDGNGEELDNDYEEEADTVPADDEEPEDYVEHISIRCYNRTAKKVKALPYNILFDGEAHGTLSNLYRLDF